MLRDADRELALLEKELLKNVPAPKVKTPKNLNTAALPKVKDNAAPPSGGARAAGSEAGRGGAPVTQAAAKPKAAPVTRAAVQPKPAKPVMYRNYANNYGADPQPPAPKTPRAPVTQRATATVRLDVPKEPRQEEPPEVPTGEEEQGGSDLPFIIGLLTAAIVCVVLYGLVTFVLP